MSKTFYEILNVSPLSTQDEIKQAYRTMAKKYHPDMNPGIDTTSLMQEITEAYEVLSDVEKRRKYDEKINNNSQSERTYASYTKSREETESDFEEWINEYLRNRRRENNIKFETEKQWEIDTLTNISKLLKDVRTNNISNKEHINFNFIDMYETKELKKKIKY